MSLIQKPTKLELEGVGTLTIRSSDYLTQGGEGAIYRNGKHIIKLALDQKKLVTVDCRKRCACCAADCLTRLSSYLQVW